ncbi:hypothetical protein JCM8547_003213 [Rhodosporidiobolus lusitaniae]
MAVSGVDSIQAAVCLLAVLSVLFGYFCLELVNYIQRFPKDRTAFKLFVAWLAFLELFYYWMRFAGVYWGVGRLITASSMEQPPVLNLMSICLTSLVEASSEGFFAWRLWRVTKKWWMRIIAVTLWGFSTFSHVAWICIAGLEGRASVTGRSKQWTIVLCAFWGTFIEGIFVASCLLWELQFGGDRRIIKHGRNSTVGQLISLAIRTSGILVFFELLVAIAVSIRSQPDFAVITEIEYAAAIYTILAATVVLYTLNFRSVMRSAPPGPSGNATAPTLRAPSTSGFDGQQPLPPQRRAEEQRKKRASAVGLGGGALATGLGLGFSGMGEGLGRLSFKLTGGGGGGGGSGGGGDGGGRGGGTGATSFGSNSFSGGRGGNGRRGSYFTGQISVQTVSHVEETTMQLEDMELESEMLGPQGWAVRERERHPGVDVSEIKRPPSALSC